MKDAEKLAVAAVVLLGGYYQWRRSIPPAPAPARGGVPADYGAGAGRTIPAAPAGSSGRKLEGLTPGAAVRLYGPAGALVTRMTEEALRIRGFAGAVVPVDSFIPLRSMGMEPRIRAAGLVDADGNIDLPFAEVDGKLYSYEDLVAGLSRLPLTNVRERATPYVFVYGPPDCPYTKQGLDVLDAHGIPYEYRDVNDPRYQPRFEVLVRAYGFKEVLWPVLEINGVLYSKPPLEVVQVALR